MSLMSLMSLIRFIETPTEPPPAQNAFDHIAEAVSNLCPCDIRANANLIYGEFTGRQCPTAPSPDELQRMADIPAANRVAIEALDRAIAQRACVVPATMGLDPIEQPVRGTLSVIAGLNGLLPICYLAAPH